jgi:raffinose/stachyose/melibiose transport system substrate-binding protein
MRVTEKGVPKMAQQHRLHQYNSRKKHTRLVAAVGAIAVGALALAGCSGGSGGSDDNTLKLWHYEGADSAMGKAWAEAIKVFEEETGATVEFEEKSFEQIQKTASQVLDTDAAPDLMEFNKGNATAGFLASTGLITDIDDAVDEYGWADKLAPSLQTTAKYSEDGVMGGDTWYGIPNYGEFVGVYYNLDAFAAAGLEVPTTYDEFIAVLDAFVAQGITPLAEAGAEYPLGQLWYQLALSQGDRGWVDDYQLYKNPVDWQGPEVTYASDTLLDYVDKGYIASDVSSVKAEDAGVSWINGTAPIFVSGSWWYGRFVAEATGFDWTMAAFPGSDLSLGSSGNLWVVPENAANKDLAYEFIDITMRPEIQAIIGNNGGLPVAADPADITDPKSQELIGVFNGILDADGLSFYPDWPAPGFYDVIVQQLQGLITGSQDAATTNENLGSAYDEGTEEYR